MSVTCGVLIYHTYSRSFLLCHVTGQPPHYYSIPKGIMDNGESSYDACIRECKEETGIILPHTIQYLGEYNYIKKKRLALYLHEHDICYDIQSLICTSFFSMNSIVYPEVDDYMYCPYNKLLFYVNKKMYNIIHDVCKKYGIN